MCKLDGPQLNLPVEVECVLPFNLRPLLWSNTNHVCYRYVAWFSHQLV